MGYYTEMKNTLKLIILALCLATAPAVFTGCETATKEQIVFYTFKDIQIIAHKAMDVFAEKVVLGKVTPAKKAEVESAYAQYQAAFKLAFVAAQNDLSKLTPTDVQRLADQLVRIIYAL